MKRRLFLLALVLPAMVCAQEPGPEGVRIGITYTPGTRPTLAVLPSRMVMLDSVRAVISRDLDFSDRFEMVRTEDVDLRARSERPARYVVSVDTAGGFGGQVRVELTEGEGGQVLHRATVSVASPAWRMATHAVADDIVRVAVGEVGIAATSLLFVREGRLMRVDADGAGLQEVRSAGSPALSPEWSPDGRTMAYTAFVPSGQPIVLQDMVTGSREVVPTTEYGMNITPAFSSDGRMLAFARGTEDGTDIYVYDVVRRCCVQRLTVGRFADNLSPTWSPDGSRIAYISTRARTPQLYVMNADGTNPEVFARFDFGATGETSAPAWSRDGQSVAFHREVGGSPQIFVLDVATRAVRQITGSGRNEDPTWAPDGRHLAFISNRSGAREVWVVDMETGRLRQLTRVGGARLPAWSPRLTPTSERQ